MIKVLTHDGGFHADEVFAAAVIAMAEGGHVVRRSSDPNVQEWADVVVDVGGRYETGGKPAFFDHHQKGGAGARPDGVPYASFGLVWRHYGTRAVAATVNVPAGGDANRWVTDRVDRVLVAPVDAADCGYELATGYRDDTAARPYSVSAAVSAINPGWDDDPRETDVAFRSAVAFAQSILLWAMETASSAHRAITAVRAAYAVRRDPRILSLPRGMPWKEALLGEIKDTEVLYAVYPDPSTGWMVQAVPPEPASFKMRKPLPIAWAGLRSAELTAVCGVPDAVFCHNSRFICGNKTEWGAHRMAELSVEAT